MIDAVVAAAGVASALATAFLGFLAYRFSRSSARQATRRTIGDLANQLAAIRLEYPEASRYGRRWEMRDWDILGGAHEGPAADLRTRYYCYVDVGLEFCNAALAARANGAISAETFRGHYGRLVRLFLTENYPIVAHMRARPFLTSDVQQELASAEAEGWVWADQHEALVGSP